MLFAKGLIDFEKKEFNFNLLVLTQPDNEFVLTIYN